MASRGGKGGGDFVLESRHLVGLFLLLVVIFGVVFTLGYLMGRNQFDSTLRAAGKSFEKAPEAPPAPVGSAPKSKAKTEGGDSPPAQTGSDWDFYHSADPSVNQLQTPKSTIVAAQPAAPKAASGRSAGAAKNTPLMAKGAIVLQVAAVLKQSDALALAQALQQKKFPAFIVAPGSDKFYRVQIGPYADAQSATIARKDLEAKGFKSIVKR